MSHATVARPAKGNNEAFRQEIHAHQLQMKRRKTGVYAQYGLCANNCGRRVKEQHLMCDQCEEMIYGDTSK